MNKQNNKLAISVITVLTTFIALVYTLLVYRDVIFAVAIVSILFLATSYMLTQNIITFITMNNKSTSVQIKNLIDDVSSQLENMSSSQAQLGKATFLYTKQTATAMSSLENSYIESQETLTKNLITLSNAQNKSTKIMLKYDQNNTMKLIASLKDLRNHLSETMTQGFDQIQPNNSDVVSALQTIVEYLKTQPNTMDQSMGLQLNNVAHELQNISNSIQRVQMPMPSAVQPMPMAVAPAPVVAPPVAEPVAPAPIQAKTTPASQDIAMPTEEIESNEPADLTQIQDLVNEDLTADTATALENELTEDITDLPTDFDAISEPENLTQLNNLEDTDEPTANLETDSPDADDLLSQLINTDEATSQEENAEDTATTMQESSEPAESLAPVSDDPNKQLSADEIAALFAATEPAPKEPEPVSEPEVAQEEFTPTFTVVGNEDTPKEAEDTPAPVSDDPNKQLSADEIAALFAAAEPAPKEPEPVSEPEPVALAPVSDDPNKQLSADEIAALFAAAEPAPKEPEPVTLAPVSDDPNKQLSADEIAALFAQMG